MRASRTVQRAPKTPPAEGDPPLAEARLRAVLEATGQHVVFVGADGFVVDISASACAFTGRPREHLIGRGWMDLVHPDDRERIAATIEAHRGSPAPIEYQFRMRRHDGVYRTLACRAVPVCGGDGKVREVIVAATDVEDGHRRDLERQELLRALEARRERLATILEALPVGVVIAEAPDGGKLQTNRTFEAFFDGPIHDVCSLERALGLDRPSPIVRALRGGPDAADDEIRVQTASGERWLRMNAAPLRDAAGAVVASLCAAVDITDRKRTEVALRSSEHLLRSCLESVPAHVWITDAVGSNVYNNRRFLEYAGMDAEAALGWGWMAALPPADRRRARRVWSRATQTAESFEFEARFRGADGKERWFLTRGEPIFDGDRLDRWFGMNIDIDERKRIEQALAESEARFRRLIDLDLLGMCTFDLRGKVLDANREYLRILGYDEDDLRAGRIKWDEIVVADEAIDRALGDELLRSGSIRPTEILCRRRDGSPIPILMTAALHALGSNTGTALLYDVTERKQIEEFQQQLIGVVGHDLRSPLAAMITTLDVMLRRADLPESDRRPLKRLRNTAERMRRITRDLLDYTRARVGEGMSLTIGDCDLHIICTEAVTEALLLAPNKEVAVTGAGDPCFRGDGKRIEQALGNLVANAVKYGTGPVEVRWRSDAAGATIEVENEGPPIDDEVRAQLFQPFRRGRQGETPVSQSLGLGLFIVREIARAHGGEATIEPLPHGNLARIVLPRSQG